MSKLDKLGLDTSLCKLGLERPQRMHSMSGLAAEP